MFDRHSYPKGARVLHMLRFVLGDDLFWKAMRRCMKKHAFTTVETSQFRIAIEEATGQGLNWFFDEWLYRGGHPEYDVRYDWDGQRKGPAAMDRPSHHEVILRAACDGPAELGDLQCGPRLRRLLDLLEPTSPPHRRIAAARALAKLAGDDPQTIDILAAQLPHALHRMGNPLSWSLPKRDEVTIQTQLRQDSDGARTEQ
ncbi:MAG TPA: hypothetical protein EYP56_01775 [Planctomycetaceae bacterium]|nr:hypothetical protein [Planctomycetaceae bacterium]